ncbi:MAG TPA: methylmalonyl Co-A mutase-associated GTPase MeaB [Cyclobacteriaceae bacterium]|nr:methylmalonyl Co-A mutase-associated GTPase MeaB [Cyclobacteriaceae bacterium]
MAAKPIASVDSLAQGVTAGDRAALARAITLVESTRPEDRQAAEQMIQTLLPRTGNSIRVGITGVPGAGKSTLIEAIGTLLTQQGHQVAVLAVDPSSQKTLGSILGDKTRMEQLSRNPKVFIRPSPAAQALGGVTQRTRETILLCEAAGYGIILVETVGVGQSETEVRNMVDFFLLLLLAGAGDELQGIKKGIMEMADGVVIHKADKDNLGPARQALADARQALHLQAPAESGWTPQVLLASSLEQSGIQEIISMIDAYAKAMKASGYWDGQRARQRQCWLDDSIQLHFMEWISHPSLRDKKKQLQQAVDEGSLLPPEAAREFWKALMEEQGKSSS